MKHLIWILLIIPVVGFSQSKKMLKHLKTDDMHIIYNTKDKTVCGEASVNYYISKKHIYIDTYCVSYDLKVVTREDKSTWIAKDKNNNTYIVIGMIIDGIFSLVIQPANSSNIALIISQKSLCQ